MELSDSLTIPQKNQSLEEILSRDDNKFCADCDEPNPTWVTLTWGAFICINCASAHRSLGVHNSFVQSIKLDDLTTEQIECLSTQGNNRVNTILEYHVGEGILLPRGGKDKWQIRKQYIQKKYEDLAFIKVEGRESRRAQRQSILLNSSEDILPCWQMEFFGVVDVKIISVKDLPKSKVNSDYCYVVTKLGVQEWKTEAVQNSKDIFTFGDKFHFCWDGQQKLAIKFFDKQKLSKDKLIAEINLGLDFIGLHNGRPVRSVFPMYSKDLKSAGTIELEISYLSLSS